MSVASEAHTNQQAAVSRAQSSGPVNKRPHPLGTEEGSSAGLPRVDGQRVIKTRIKCVPIRHYHNTSS